MSHGYTSVITDAERTYALEATRAAVFRDVLDSIRRDNQYLKGDDACTAQRERADYMRRMLAEAVRLDPALAPVIFETARGALLGEARPAVAPA